MLHFRKVLGLIVALGLTGSSLLTANAQATQPAASNTYSSPIAYVGVDGNVYVTQLGGGTGTALTNDASGGPTNYYPYHEPLRNYANLRWSPDGSTLAFTEGQNGTLYIAHSGQPPQAAAQKIAPEFPPFWSADGQTLGYATAVQPAPTSAGQDNYAIETVALSGGAPKRLLTFSSQTGCGGGGFGPAEAAYMQDNGYIGNHLTLAPVVDGYLYSESCLGIGLGLIDTNGHVIWSQSDLGRAALSPDGKQLIAIQISTKGAAPGPVGLVKVDLATGKETALKTKPNVDQIGWSGDNTTILYSTVKPDKTLTAKDPNSKVGQAAIGFWPPSPNQMRTYVVSLWKMPAEGGDSAELAQSEGRGIGSIGGTSDGPNAIFTAIDSLAAMVDAINAGKSVDEVKQAAPLSTITVVQLNGQKAAILDQGSLPSPGHGSFTAFAAKSGS